jgi:predicted transcriptional regulator
MTDVQSESNDLLTLTAEIVAAYVSNAAHVKADEIPAVIRSVHQALQESSAPQAEDAEPAAPAAKMDKRQINKSITPDALISFVDGKPYKTLKRHLSRHGMDMKAYREQYGLPADYPSVAPNYSAARSEMARKLGLGARGSAAKAAPAPEAAPAAAKRGRKASA